METLRTPDDRQMLLALLDRLDLWNIRLVCQDWGGLLGLTLPMSRLDRFSGLPAMNTALGTGDVPLGDGFLAWRSYVREHPDFDIAALMQRSTPGLSPEEASAYAAHFPISASGHLRPARELLVSAGNRLVFCAVPDGNEAATSAVQQLGFTPVRPLTRMRLGPSVVRNDAQAQFAIADLSTG
ncbi:MAG: hypothetical protein ACQEQ7_12680 [Thermodesulfobacteriota bacterium]